MSRAKPVTSLQKRGPAQVRSNSARKIAQLAVKRYDDNMTGEFGNSNQLGPPEVLRSGGEFHASFNKNYYIIGGSNGEQRTANLKSQEEFQCLHFRGTYVRSSFDWPILADFNFAGVAGVLFLSGQNPPPHTEARNF